MGKFGRSWELTKQSGRVLMADKQLMVFPVLSSIACIAVLATFAVPVILLVDWGKLFHEVQTHKGAAREVVRPEWWWFLVSFAYYFCNFFVITFFNSALIGCAINRFHGRPSGVKDGLAVAMSRLPQIAAWSLVSATVGVILQAVQERTGIIGKIVLNFIGMVWTIGTFFVVPVLVVEKVGPITAIKRSVEILKKTWGESLISNLGIGAVTGLLVGFGVLALLGGVAASIAMQSPWPAVVIGGLFVLYMLAIALVSATLKGILLAATYEFAATGEVPSGFDDGLLRGAFKPKGS
jgi:magnesium-transporting ATPase (P-type)